MQKVAFPPPPQTLEIDLLKQQITQTVYSLNAFAACIRHSVSLHSQKKRL